MKKLFLIFVLFVVIASGCIFQQEQKVTEEGPGKYDDFAKCLNEQGLRMYGTFICSICKKQRNLFGSSFQYIEEIECHPNGENPQTELCFEKEIAKTPTWILEKDGVEIKRLKGYQNLETLTEFSGCSIEEI